MVVKRGSSRAGNRGKSRSSAVDPARRAAYDVLRAVSERDSYANLALAPMLAQRGISGRDAAFATEVCYGTLRSRGTLDHILAAVSSRPLRAMDPVVLDALRLGAYQLLYTRVPAHAAVSTAVELARVEKGRGVAGFANAVLRRVAERDADAWIAELAPVDGLDRLAFAHAHPRWVVQAFADALGGDPNQVEAALAADNTRPSVHLAALPGRISREQLAEQAGGRPGALSRYAVHLPGGSPGELAAVVERRATVQDEGSQAVALAVADAPIVGSDSRWLDLCAGPGGKAALWAALAGQRDASLVAVEVAPHRARLVAESVEGLPAQVIQADGRDVGARAELPEAGFDRVLVDAPCTGLGALRRRPEARWRRTPEDLPGLTALQQQLLAAGVRAARVGGVVGYVTCSPHPAETAAIVAAAEGAELVDARPLFGAAEQWGEGPAVQLWPHRHGTDAMFLAVFRRLG
ncbi:MAG: RsmB/NOP family class I SAM-dependent RNA methyltransferase [Micromonosporaceae bacterium]